MPGIHAMKLYAHVCKGGTGNGGILQKFLFSTVVDFHRVIEVPQVSDKRAYRDQNFWNSLIKGCSKNGDYQHSLILYHRMRKLDSLQPSKHTFVALLKACAKLKDVKTGSEIHAHIFRQGLYVEKDVFVGSALVDMYAKCGSLAKAQEVFHKLPVKNAVSWTTLIVGFADNGLGEEAIDCFEQMRKARVYADEVTYVCTLKACCNIRTRHMGQEIHAQLTSKGWDKDLVIGSALIDLYAKCGLLADSQEVFDMLPSHDTISWTALIAGYTETGRGEEALYLFERMQHDGFSADAATFVCSLKACGSVGVTERGLEIHAEIARRQLGGNFLVESTLVDMYVKCGLLVKAQETFDKLSSRDVVSWTTLLVGYSQVGKSKNVFDIFDRMIEEGIRPNLATFSSVLNACSHAGLVNKGQMYLYTMMKDHDLVPTVEHYTCILDLLTRAGHIDSAFAFIEQIPCHPVMAVWHTVLRACRKSSNLELGRHAFEHAEQLDEQDASSYVGMYNVYADALIEDNANKVESY